ncbi:hypothetical protein ACFYXQ_10115 [Nocardia jiangxiensis]|uniref:DUF222 domain-containing protein n=1 Tax=Nocardia jiangxiensis TaxID=282685 RepID=A0ABW6RVU1_9NOCA
MREVTPRIQAEADRVVGELVERGRFEVVTDLAEHLPMTVVSDLVGLPEHARAKMLDWAAAIWDTQGPADDRVAAATRSSGNSSTSPSTTPSPAKSPRTAGPRTCTRPPTAARSRARSARW